MGNRSVCGKWGDERGYYVRGYVAQIEACFCVFGARSRYDLPEDGGHGEVCLSGAVTAERFV